MNYPGGIKKTNNHLINYKNRGMNLENDLNNIIYNYKRSHQNKNPRENILA